MKGSDEAGMGVAALGHLHDSAFHDLIRRQHIQPRAVEVDVGIQLCRMQRRHDLLMPPFE